MKGYYTSIVPGIALSISIAELPRRDQWALCHHLMQKIGLTDALYGEMNLFPAQRATLDKLFTETVDRFIKAGGAEAPPAR